MIIDFHTHIFPDELAAKALKSLTDNIGDLFTPVHDGTAAGLIRNMDDWQIDVSVVQPVITKQSQVRTVNEWAAEICSDRLVCFGGIYPHTSSYKEDIDFVASLGLKGLKFHAEFQDFILDDEHMLKIYDYALGKGLIIMHHAGLDPAFAPPYRSSPKRFANVLGAMRGGVIVAAHLGGHGEWDDVERYLVGTEIYLDTSMGFEYFSHESFLRIVANHGCDKILFGSDAPWSSAKTEVELLRSLPVSDEAAEAILCGNAKRILGRSGQWLAT